MDKNTAGSVPFIRILKGGFLIGNRMCQTGDVLKVLEMGEVPVNEHGIAAIMPVVNKLDYSRACKLIKMGFAKAEQHGPSPVETTSLKETLKRSEKAVAAPQRGAM